MAEIANHVFPVTLEGFTAEVVERSREVPVLLLFCAEQVPPSMAQRNVLETLAAQYAGKFALGIVDVGQDPAVAQQLAQQMRIQGLPAIRVIRDGQMAAELDGPQDEGALRALVDQQTMTGGELVKAQLAVLVAQGRHDDAIAMLQQAITDEPANPVFKVEMADVLVQAHRLDDAEAVLASTPEDAPERDRPAARLECAREVAGLPPAADVAAQLAADEDNLTLRYQMAIHAAAAGGADGLEQAMELALSILMQNKKFDDELGRRTLLRLFSIASKANEAEAKMVQAYRRRMFAFLH